jgi:hypothetical protein
MAIERGPFQLVRRPRRERTQLDAHGRGHMAPFWYGSTGRRAPKLVQFAIAQFRQLPTKVRAQVPLLWWLLGESTAQFKMTQPEAQYGSPPPDRQQQRCRTCLSAYQHITTGTLICSQMAGTIAPEAWCRLWKPAISPQAYATLQERK